MVRYIYLFDVYSHDGLKRFWYKIKCKLKYMLAEIILVLQINDHT